MNDAELRRVFILASAFKEGDVALGAARDERERSEARQALAARTLGEIAACVLVEDGVSEALAQGRDPAAARELSPLSVAEAKRRLLSDAAAAWTERASPGLSSEAIAAVAKVMTDEELSRVARSLFHPLPGAGVRIGSAGHFGSRIQPNSPGDDETEILFSILEGLAWGCGDVILGLNPASDDVDTIVRLEELLGDVVTALELPTRTCVLSDVVKQDAARRRTRVDVGFQSLAGTSKSLAGMVGLDVPGILELARGFDGLYFETGQGSEITNGAAEGVDMGTLESRTYGVARALARATGKWTIVNDVAGFIGPEVFREEWQLRRACLEDCVMAKLHGLTMGLDVCATFHMGIEPRALARTTEAIVEQAAPAYLMAVAGNADPMLGYLTTSFREHPRLRARTGRRISTAMTGRLAELGIPAGGADGSPKAVAALFAAYRRARGDARSNEALCSEGEATIARLRDRGFDLGLGGSPAASARLEAVYSHARCALEARVDPAVLRDVAPRAVGVRTLAATRDEFLARPATGERVRDDDARRLRALGPARAPVQIVLSDGLNANALNENLRAVLPPLRAGLAAAGIAVSDFEVRIENGRLRAGYHVGELLGPDVVVHLIGERPGTGLDTLSAYLTYGRGPDGEPRWSPDLDHSLTTAVCGIHPAGKPPVAAVEEIARAVRTILERRVSGVALGAAERPAVKRLR